MHNEEFFVSLILVEAIFFLFFFSFLGVHLASGHIVTSPLARHPSHYVLMHVFKYSLLFVLSSRLKE